MKGQTLSFYPRQWAQRWPEELPRPAILAEPGKVSVSRKQLFELGKSIDTDEDLLNFYVQVCGWGSGTSALSAARTARPLRFDPVPKLRQALKPLRAGDPVEAYRLLNNECHIKYLGPAFFTKLLYFADPKGKALILDQRVATSLGAKTKSDWTTPQYAEYLETAETIRTSLDRDLTGDCVEYLLFQR